MRVSVTHIIAAARDVSSATVDEIIGPQRNRHIVITRQACYYLARLQGYSFSYIAGRMGGKDHTSVMHGVKQCENMMTRDPNYSYFVYEIGARAFARSEREREKFRQLGAELEAESA